MYNDCIKQTHSKAHQCEQRLHRQNEYCTREIFWFVCAAKHKNTARNTQARVVLKHGVHKV